MAATPLCAPLGEQPVTRSAGHANRIDDFVLPGVGLGLAAFVKHILPYIVVCVW